MSVVVLKNPVGRSLEVVELTVLQRPPEQCADREHQHDGKRNQEVERVHDQRDRIRRDALRTTSSELAPMPMPASQGVTHPAAASGSMITL